MRKLIYGINLSLDGCCDHTKFGGSEEILNYFTEVIKDIDLFIYGRKTYELMVPYWPDAVNNPDSSPAEVAYAKAFEAADRVVFSQTLQSLNDEKATLFHGNIAEEIIKFKQQAGKNINIGGVDLALQVIELGLVDEFIIVIHPTIVGEGRRLFTDGKFPERLKLQLADTKALPSGCVVLRYAKQ